MSENNSQSEYPNKNDSTPEDNMEDNEKGEDTPVSDLESFQKQLSR